MTPREPSASMFTDPPVPLAEERFRLAIEAASVAMIMVDRQGRIVMANPQAGRLFGYPHQELLEQSAESLLPERFRSADPADHTTFFDHPDDRPAPAWRDWYGLRKDHTEVPVEIGLTPITTGEGHFVLASIIDITERKRTEQALRDGEARLAGIIDSAMDAVISIDPDQRIVLFNQAAEHMFGCKAGEALGGPIERFIPTQFQGPYAHYINEFMRAGSASGPLESRAPLYGMRTGGEPFPTEATISQVDVAGVKLVTLIIRDVTVRTQSEAQIQASLQEKEVLLREIHHRVKNNLQVIASLLNLQADQIPDEHTRVLLYDTQARVRSMALIHEKFSRSTSLAEINLGDYMRELVEDLFRAYSLHDVRYKVHAAAVLINIDTAIPCGLIASELISNCLKHAYPDGRSGQISVTLAVAEPGLFDLVVEDDGVGLPSNFEAHRTESLGLQLVDTLTRQLGASLQVESHAGTTFRLRFKESLYKARV